MIVVEGPDGAGKSTLAHLIADEMGREYRRPPSLSGKTGPGEDHVDWWREELWSGNTHVAGGVYDRIQVISEPIYSAVLDRSPKPQPAEMREMLERFISTYPLIVFCLPPWAEQKKNLEDKTKDKLQGLNIKKAAKVLWLYYNYRTYWEYLSDRALCRVLTYDWANAHEVMPAVAQYLTEEANSLGRPADN